MWIRFSTFNENRIVSWKFLKFLSSIYLPWGHVKSPTKFRPDRFSRFDVYWIQSPPPSRSFLIVFLKCLEKFPIVYVTLTTNTGSQYSIFLQINFFIILNKEFSSNFRLWCPVVSTRLGNSWYEQNKLFFKLKGVISMFAWG